MRKTFGYAIGTAIAIATLCGCASEADAPAITLATGHEP